MCLLSAYLIRKDFFLSLNIKFNEKLKYFEDISIATLIFLKSESLNRFQKLYTTTIEEVTIAIIFHIFKQEMETIHLPPAPDMGGEG